MSLARASGIEVPLIELVNIIDIRGLPADAGTMEGKALAVQRFDRSTGGESTHMEDFAQVFGVYPEDKYHQCSYANIASVLWAETGEVGTYEFFAAAGFFGADRKCRYAPQELVPSISRPPRARVVACLRFCIYSTLYTWR